MFVYFFTQIKKYNWKNKFYTQIFYFKEIVARISKLSYQEYIGKKINKNINNVETILYVSDNR